MPTRGAFAGIVVAVALLATCAGCARPLPAHVIRAATRPSLALLAGASACASEAATAMRVSETTRAVTPVDPAPYLGKPLRRAETATDAVAITLDDGPSANTADVIDIFERYEAGATFFYVGDRTPRYRAHVARAYRAGLEVANHTWDHSEISKEPLEFDLDQIDRCQSMLESVTGARPVFVRPTSGHWDPTTLKAATQRGLVLALWSLHGHDTGPGTHADEIARGVVAGARGGDVILLHETNRETVEALPAILEGLRAKGLRPVTLSELLAR